MTTPTTSARGVTPARRLLPVRVSGVRVLSTPHHDRPDRMLLQFATLERIAGSLNGLDGRDGALHGRMRHLTKHDFPVPLAKGRGAKSAVGINDGLRLLFAFELLDVGLPPLHAVRILDENWDDVRRALAYAWTRVEAAKPGGDPERDRRLVVVEPALLSDLASDGAKDARGGRAAEGGPDEELSEFVGALSPAAISARLAAADQPRHWIVLDAERFMRRVADLLAATTGATAAEVETELRLFCTNAFGTADRRSWTIPATYVAERQRAG